MLVPSILEKTYLMTTGWISRLTGLLGKRKYKDHEKSDENGYS